MRWLTFILFLLLATPAFAGPVGHFRTGKGVVIKGEVMYVDDHYYYCRKVTDRSAEFTVKVDDVPLSFRRRVDQLRLSGELKAPPQGQGRLVEVEEKEARYGDWELTDYRQKGDHRAGIAAWLQAKDDAGRETHLFVRSRYNKLDVLLSSGDKVTMIRKWLITYRIDDQEYREQWTNAVNRRGLFAPMPYVFCEKLMDAEVLEFEIPDKDGGLRRIRFNVSNFDEVYKDFKAQI